MHTSGSGEDFGWALLRLNGVQLILNTAYESDERPPAADPNPVVGHGDTGLSFGCPDAEGAYQHLRGKGLDVGKPVIRTYGMKQLNITAPDGYNLVGLIAVHAISPN